MTTKYRYKYIIEESHEGFTADIISQAAPDVKLNRGNSGYAQDLILVSIMYPEPVEDDGHKYQSSLILSTKDKGFPSRNTLVRLRDLVIHYLEHGRHPSKPAIERLD